MLILKCRDDGDVGQSSWASIRKLEAASFFNAASGAATSSIYTRMVQFACVKWGKRHASFLFSFFFFRSLGLRRGISRLPHGVRLWFRGLGNNRIIELLCLHRLFARLCASNCRRVLFDFGTFFGILNVKLSGQGKW